MTQKMPAPIAITPGEPAGIGPDILIDLVYNATWPTPLVAFADPDFLSERARILHQPIHINTIYHPQEAQHSTPKKTLAVIPVALNDTCQPGQLNPNNAAYVIETLKQANKACLSHECRALVTGPVQKHLIHQSGIPFSGHTEWLREESHSKKTVMLFEHPRLRMALLTTHLPLSEVCKQVTADNLTDTIHTLAEGLEHYFDLKNPRILVCGLNPHAGENGQLGSEEIEIIAPTLNALSKMTYNVTGPVPADTAFTPKSLKQTDCVLALYHDQGLPVIKSLGFGEAVNVTLGLPYLRTSVDHGTALDLAGTGKTSSESLKAALNLAHTLSQRKNG